MCAKRQSGLTRRRGGPSHHKEGPSRRQSGPRHRRRGPRHRAASAPPERPVGVRAVRSQQSPPRDCPHPAPRAPRGDDRRRGSSQPIGPLPRDRPAPEHHNGSGRRAPARGLDQRDAGSQRRRRLGQRPSGHPSVAAQARGSGGGLRLRPPSHTGRGGHRRRSDPGRGEHAARRRPRVRRRARARRRVAGCRPRARRRLAQRGSRRRRRNSGPAEQPHQPGRLAHHPGQLGRPRSLRGATPPDRPAVHAGQRRRVRRARRDDLRSRTRASATSST